MPVLSTLGAATAKAWGFLRQLASSGAAGDPYFKYVTSLLHGDGTNGGQNNTFLDSSSNAFTITRNGNTTQGSFSPYGSNWGNYFDGAGASQIALTSSVSAVGTGNFTCEFWFCLSANTSYDQRFIDLGSSGFDIYYSYQDGTYKIRLQDRVNAGADVCETPAISVGQWYHVAVVRSGTGSNQTTIYLNGTQGTSGTCSSNFSSTSSTIGSRYAASGGQWYGTKGYISNLRYTSTAVYSSNFTPSTTPLTAISGTILLTCQSNRFIDNSTNAYALTVVGSPQVTRFSPFAPTYATQYSASTIGGSGYFDGSGDYLTVPSNTAFNLGSGDFTIECWWYPTNFNNDSEILNATGSGGTLRNFSIYSYGSNGTMGYYAGTGGSSWDIVSNLNGGTAIKNAWNHLAFTRSGTTFATFLNGTRVATTTASGTLGLTANLGIGANQSGGGAIPASYISDCRIVKGTALYTASTYTVPTAPLTAVSGTGVLTNFTNGAIYDNAEVADYETVGNAQISTSVKKYGTGSISFDGTGDYLLTDAPDSEFAFGGGNFTIEMWVYLNSVASYKVLYDGRPTGTVGAYNTIYLNSGTLIYEANNAARITGITLSTSTWYHIAVCRAGTSTKMFVNGTQVGSTYSDSTTYLIGAQRPVIGADGTNLASNNLNGYIDDLRITKGYARYWENFTPPSEELPNFSNPSYVPPQDAQFNYTTLLLPGNGTNGAQNNTFLDSSTNAFTITRNGNTTQGTFSPFSQTGWGNYFDGSGDYLATPSNAAFAFGTGDYTIETWVYPQQFANQQIFNFSDDADNLSLDPAGTLTFYDGSIYTTGATYVLNQWQHIAYTRSSGTVRIFLNGTLVKSFSSSYNSGTRTAYFGARGIPTAGTNCLLGYMSNIRIVKGTAVYTSNFTPSTTPLTAVSGTSVLTAQSNRFIDNSTNAFAITVNGNPQVQAFSPFAPTAAYSASTVGGSGYFDGNGDYLTAPTTTVFSLNGDFTIEGWIYPTGLTNELTAFCIGDQNSGGLLLYVQVSTQKWRLYSGGELILSSTTVKNNAWYHVAVVRSGSTITLYVNGTSVGTTSNSSTFDGSSGNGVAIGGTYGSGSYSASSASFYLGGFRVVKGTAVYTTTFTPPTAPLTAITNTGLLLNFTNAGITDATAKNDLETVGNAQISTTQSKFGGSSMVFNGSSDYLKLASSPNISFGSGDFTVEAWVYINSTTSYMTLMASYPYHQNGISTVAFRVGTGGTYASWTDGGGTPAASLGGLSWSTATWYHVAWCRYNGVVTMYRNGQVVGTVSDSTNFSVGGQTIGADFDAGSFYNGFNGYINDFRITKGYARYVQPFTPPAQADQLY